MLVTLEHAAAEAVYLSGVQAIPLETRLDRKGTTTGSKNGLVGTPNTYRERVTAVQPRVPTERTFGTGCAEQASQTLHTMRDSKSPYVGLSISLVSVMNSSTH